MASYKKWAALAFTNRSGDTPVTEIKPLTTLRFIAALAVLLEHLPMIPGLHWVGNTGLALGKIGVTTFFVLSGYIISFSYLGYDWVGNFRENCVRFYWTRFARIYPLHWFVFLFALPLGLASKSAAVIPSDIPYLFTLTENLWPGFHPSSQPVKAAWTLSCEILFYLIAPFVLYFLRRTMWPVRAAMLLIVMYTIAITWAIGQQPTWNWIAYARVPEFLLGILAFLVTRGRDLSRVSLHLLVIGLLVLLFAPPRDDTRLDVMLFLGHAIGAMLVILGCSAAVGRIRRVLSIPLLVLLGHASYAFYLLHDPILRYTRGLMVRTGLAVPGISGLLLAFSLLFFTTVSSIVIYKLVETPARRYLRSFVKSADRRLPREPADREPARA